MKFAKILALLLAAILCVASFTACLGNDDKEEVEENDDKKDNKDDKDDKDEDEDNEDDDDASASSYREAIENYLDYFAERQDDAKGLITDAYFGGGFGSVLNCNGAYDANVVYIKSLFGLNGELPDMYYYDIPSTEDGNVDWEKYVEESMIYYLYESFDEFGDWKLEYSIKDADELDEDELDEAYDAFENCIEEYEGLIDTGALGSDEEKAVEKLLDKVYDAEIEEAYSVDVKIQITGNDNVCGGDEEGLFTETYEFVVAKINGEWVILVGPAIGEIYERADG